MDMLALTTIIKYAMFTTSICSCNVLDRDFTVILLIRCRCPLSNKPFICRTHHITHISDGQIKYTEVNIIIWTILDHYFNILVRTDFRFIWFGLQYRLLPYYWFFSWVVTGPKVVLRLFFDIKNQHLYVDNTLVSLLSSDSTTQPRIILAPRGSVLVRALMWLI